MLQSEVVASFYDSLISSSEIADRGEARPDEGSTHGGLGADCELVRGSGYRIMLPGRAKKNERKKKGARLEFEHSTSRQTHGVMHIP